MTCQIFSVFDATLLSAQRDGCRYIPNLWVFLWSRRTGGFDLIRTSDTIQNGKTITLLSFPAWVKKKLFNYNLCSLPDQSSPDAANCLIKNVTRCMTETGSLTHNGCYPIKGPQRRANYESTVKKRIYRSDFFTVQKSFLSRKNDHPRRILCYLRISPKACDSITQKVQTVYKTQG